MLLDVDVVNGYDFNFSGFHHDHDFSSFEKSEFDARLRQDHPERTAHLSNFFRVDLFWVRIWFFSHVKSKERMFKKLVEVIRNYIKLEKVGRSLTFISTKITGIMVDTLIVYDGFFFSCLRIYFSNRCLEPFKTNFR